MRGKWFALVGLGCLSWGMLAAAAEFDQTRPVKGLRQNLPQLYAIVGTKIVVAPGRVIEVGSLVVRDGVIEAVGKDVDVPAEATQWDLSGQVIYAGLIDAYAEVEVEGADNDKIAAYWNSHVQPQRSVALAALAAGDQNRALRSQGVTLRLVAPTRGIIKGRSAVVTTADVGPNRNLLRTDVALHLRLAVPRQRSQGQYPSSPMGAVALARQAIYDALWYRDAWQVFESQVGAPRPERNLALEALQPYVDRQRLVMIDTADEQYLLRADRFAREFGLRAAWVGSGNEYRRIREVAATGRPVIVPLNFPQAPDVGSPESAASVSLERLMHWDHAPENAARLQAAGVSIAFTSHGLDSPKSFLAALRTAVRRGLAADDALRALTVFPSRLFELDHLVGTLEPGKLANFFVTDGDLFDKQTKVLETWVDGERYVVDPRPEMDLRGRWELDVQQREAVPELVLSGEPKKMKAAWRKPHPDDSPIEDKPEGEPDDSPIEDDPEDEPDDSPIEDKPGDEPGDSPIEDDPEDDPNDSPIEDDPNDSPIEDEPGDEPLEKFQLHRQQISAQFDATSWGIPSGVVLLSATLVPIEHGEQRMIGHVTLPDGTSLEFTGRRVAMSSEPTDDEPNSKEGESDREKASFPVNFPLGAFGVSEPPTRAESVLFRQATVWTCGPDGVLDRADVLVRRGRIERVADRIDDPPEGVIEVDCSGRHLTPGIIDCHSHMATDGGVNESTQAITAEVRVGDFIDARDISIYRQLAGGVTTSNILHGSANPIGGQNQVIKLRWGSTGEAMKFQDAPAGIKFALGENVKRSNWTGGYSSRYPQSRMGVEQIVRDAFLTARQYRHRQRRWRETRKGLPPRYDLELEALAEIQEGKRWIHCHSYRQDEILALLRTLESFGIQVGTLQHVLEGYKVADAMKRHGAMASAFSDWWTYKVEVLDAIPFNGSLMREAGVTVSFNSDDRELARHLNHEAAKAMKYGGVPAEEALKFVTLNPARQLRIDDDVGSIEVGKHADLVLWSGSPLSVTSRCEQTWIEGRKYFDLVEDRAARPRWKTIRATLVQKILQSGKDMQEEDDRKAEERELWPRVDIYCRLRAQVSNE